jgi:hypothetical protein
MKQIKGLGMLNSTTDISGLKVLPEKYSESLIL